MLQVGMPLPPQALAVGSRGCFLLCVMEHQGHLATSDAFLVSSQDCSAHGGDGLRRIETFLDGRVLSMLSYFVAFLSISNISAKEMCVSVHLALFLWCQKG